MKSINVLSLFDGISSGQVALQRVGIKVDRYFASEIDKYAIQVTQKNFPETIQLGDINNFEEWDLPKIDLLIGGSPCQDLSIAKKDRKGLDGERSGLFWRYVDCLRKFKPKYFLLENVASMPKEAKKIITDTLGVEPIMINSALVSAQQRKRLYWTNIPSVTQPEDKGIVLKDVLESEATRIPACGSEKSRSLTAHYSNNCGGWVDRITDPNPAKQQVDLIAEPVILQQGHGFNAGGTHKDKSPTLTSGGAFEQNNFVIESKYKLYNFYNKKNLKDKSPALTSACGCLTSSSSVAKIEDAKLNTIKNNVYSVRNKIIYFKYKPYKIELPDGDYIIRKLTPIECERLQTLDDDYTSDISNTQRYKCIGNGWTVDIIAHIFSFIPKEDL